MSEMERSEPLEAETIYAMASAAGRAGVSVFRLSGPHSGEVASSLAGPLPDTRRPFLRSLKDPDTQELIDEAMILLFPVGKSFTGEEVVELHTHGSPAVRDKLLGVLSKDSRCRLAQPGEFTKRAMYSGRLDLIQAEALGDLISSDTEMQRQQALSQMSGELSIKVEKWRSDLIRCFALLTTAIDFSDEDVPEDVTEDVRETLVRCLVEFDKELSSSNGKERLRDGFQVAIIGPPNAGKSTLINAIAGRNVAIVDHEAGTTRDVIEVHLDLNGIPVTFLDTAGMRSTENSVEAQGVERARARATEADLRIALLDQGVQGQSELEVGNIDIQIAGKRDLTGVGVSGLTGDGVDELLKRVETLLKDRLATSGSLVRARHREAMQMASDNLKMALGQIDDMTSEPEILAEELRSAVSRLDSLIGRIDVEDILDVVFSSFCIGK